MIPVTKPYLPPIEELAPYLEEMWRSRVLSNQGPFALELEEALANFLGLEHISLFANATLALMVAQKALEISGEVITTPYTFAATAHSITWMNNVPVFVDVEKDSLTLDPTKVEAAITDATAAIMPLHCYGNSCNTAALSAIAEKYGLKLIYDACHSFGVDDDGGSVLRHGDVSVVSFHATKVFNTFEGGMLVSRDADGKRKVDELKNFGFLSETSIRQAGVNGKMSEFGAAVGLLQLKYFSAVVAERELRYQRYVEALRDIPGIKIMHPSQNLKPNYSYMPVLVCSDYGKTRDQLFYHLRDNEVGCRRYFYPLVPDFEVFQYLRLNTQKRFPNAFSAAEAVICLPLYPDLPLQDVESICHLIAFYRHR